MFLTAGRMSILASVCMATGTCAFAGRVLKVGEGCEFARPSQAASNGTMLSIGEEGPYPGSSLVIRGGSFENRRATGVEVWHAPGVTVR